MICRSLLAIALILVEEKIAAPTEQMNSFDSPVLRIEPVCPQPNLLANSSFEEIEGDHPKAWSWSRRDTDATLTVDDATAHTGRRSIRLTNSTEFGPHVYAMLQLIGGVAVKPRTTYTFSCYFKSTTDAGIGWFGGGAKWQTRLRFPRNTHGQWVRLVLPFVTGSEEMRIPVLISTESPTRGFWVDDVQLVESREPAPVMDIKSDVPTLRVELPESRLAGPHGALAMEWWNPTRFWPEKYLFAADTLRLQGVLHVPHELRDVTLTAKLTTTAGKALAERSRQVDLPAGTYLVAPEFKLGGLAEGDVRLALQLQGKSRSAEPPLSVASSLDRSLVSKSTVQTAIARAESFIEPLRERIESLRQSGRDPAYPLVTLTILENFSGFARQDTAHHELARAYDAALEMEAMARTALAREFLPATPRFVTPVRRPAYRIDGPAQLGTVRWPDGHTETNWPLQFVGVGHFGQVQRDVEKLPGYGMNLIQVEFGPRSVVVGENAIETEVIDKYVTLLDRAARSGVGVILLLSPHYFPEWAVKKWPHLRDAEGGLLPIEATAKHPRRVDYEYERAGTANIFMFTEPLSEWRQATARPSKTKVDWAVEMARLLDSRYKRCEKVILVSDNLNTHTKGAFYEAFKPDQARQYVRHIEFRHTPKHGSWLNIAENELSSITRQCIGRSRVGDLKTLRERIRDWSNDVNKTQRGVDWQMKIDDARCKLKSVYPKIKL